MSTDNSSELLAYHAFVKLALAKGGTTDNDASPAAFREYQHQLNQLRAALQPAADRFRRGEEANEIDVGQIVEEVLGNQSPQARQD
jgi:hypothetical protein